MSKSQKAAVTAERVKLIRERRDMLRHGIHQTSLGCYQDTRYTIDRIQSEVRSLLLYLHISAHF